LHEIHIFHEFFEFVIDFEVATGCLPKVLGYGQYFIVYWDMDEIEAMSSPCLVDVGNATTFAMLFELYLPLY
jgi:hypothetical protein